MNIIRAVSLEGKYKSWQFEGCDPLSYRYIDKYENIIAVRLESSNGHTQIRFTKEEFLTLFSEVIKDLTNDSETPSS